MAPPWKHIFDHFTHPDHPLTKINDEIQYICRVCWTPGVGKRYRCDYGCDFESHEYCGTCPKSLSSFMHPHKLHLVKRTTRGDSQSGHVCDLCRNHLEGCFYKCKDCNFNLHPLCIQLPEILRHMVNTRNLVGVMEAPQPPQTNVVEHFTHSGHQLMQINDDIQYVCNVCKTPGAGRRYGCDRGCDYNLHEYCATCPKSLSAFMHPHQLCLVRQMAQGNNQNFRVCDVCHNNVEGLFYRCKDCDFDVHPLCTQLSEISRRENSRFERRFAMRELESPRNNPIEHFIHRGHRLIEFNANIQYLCHVCKTLGVGKRYRCDRGCDFDLHEYCGTCPKTLSSFIHLHKLRLVKRNAQGNSQSDRVCNMCRNNVEGLFYRCKICDFDVHPLCSQLPQTLRHVLDETHLLKLEALSSSNLCVVCEGICTSWRYRCGLCGFDIHLDCVLVTEEQTIQQETQNSVPQPAFQSPPPPYYAYGQPPHGGYRYGNPYRPFKYNTYRTIEANASSSS